MNSRVIDMTWWNLLYIVFGVVLYRELGMLGLAALIVAMLLVTSVWGWIIMARTSENFAAPQKGLDHAD